MLSMGPTMLHSEDNFPPGQQHRWAAQVQHAMCLQAPEVLAMRARWVGQGASTCLLTCI